MSIWEDESKEHGTCRCCETRNVGTHWITGLCMACYEVYVESGCSTYKELKKYVAQNIFGKSSRNIIYIGNTLSLYSPQGRRACLGEDMYICYCCKTIIPQTLYRDKHTITKVACEDCVCDIYARVGSVGQKLFWQEADRMRAEKALKEALYE